MLYAVDIAYQMGRFTRPDPTVTDCSTAHLTDITSTVDGRTDSETLPPLPLLAYCSVLLVGVRTGHTINYVPTHITPEAQHNTL